MDTIDSSRLLEQDKLLDKLSTQIESFQESFETLLKCRSISEMAAKFGTLLYKNFDIKNYYFFYRKNPEAAWEVIGHPEKISNEGLEYLTDGKEFRIIYLEDGQISSVILLPLADQSTMGIILGKKSGGGSLSVFDRMILQILLQVFSSAYKAFLGQKRIKKLVFDLNEKVFQLNNLIDSGIELSKFGKTTNLYQLALERVSSITNSSSALIKISSGSPDEQEQYFTFPKGTDPDDIMKAPGKISSGFELEDKVYTIILSQKETREGSENFNELDRVLLDAVTRQVSASIENEFWHNESLEKERYQKELNVAASIQQQIIPDKLPQIPGYEIAAKNIPSQEVGGDYYDCINLGNGKYALIIADVAGKGIGAALLVNTLSAALYSYLDFNVPLTEMSDKLNKLIFKASPADKFITFFIAVLDAASGQLDTLNAGHNPIMLLRKDGTLEQISAGGVGLGMFDFGIPFKGQTMYLHPGDKLFLYTDGIPEAMNQSEEEYTDEKMIQLFTSNTELHVEDFVDAMIEDVKIHTAGFPQSDDITLLVLKRIEFVK